MRMNQKTKSLRENKSTKVKSSTAFQFLQDLKRAFRRYNVKHIDGLAVMPPSPNELKDVLPRAYAMAFGADPPVVSRVEAWRLDRLTELIPMRSTRVQLSFRNRPSHDECYHVQQRDMEFARLPGLKFLTPPRALAGQSPIRGTMVLAAQSQSPTHRARVDDVPGSFVAKSTSSVEKSKSKARTSKHKHKQK